VAALTCVPTLGEPFYVRFSEMPLVSISNDQPKTTSGRQKLCSLKLHAKF
jgi:hypothetical protein